MSCDLIIKGGLAVLENGPAQADIFIAGGKIKRVAKPAEGSRGAARVLDASGLIVLPGLIDAHVHYSLHLGGGKMTADDFYAGSAAAACGGVTSVIDYTGQGPGIPLRAGLKERIEEAEGLMHVDYGFHAVVPSWKRLSDPAAQLKELMGLGVTSFKFFTAYESRGLMASDAELFEALECSRRTGALICVHAETGGLIDLLVERRRREKHPGADAHRLSRPDFTESEAVRRALALAELAGGSIYFVHLSSGVSAGLIAGARGAGVRALGETAPQYLILRDSVLKRRDGHLYATCPPVRTTADSKALWRALGNGTVGVIATDSCTFTTLQKEQWAGDIGRLPMGLPGTQTMLPLIYTFGVKGGRLELRDLARLLSSNPAKVMGLYPRKGAIKPGSDADLAVIDPVGRKTVDYRELQHKTDYSPYQGMELRGWPRYTVLRGEVIAENGKLARPDRPSGRFLRRKRGELAAAGRRFAA
ncbi:MAG: dihydropyrimidinase [Elusimicrobiales bacterium]|jgi:dihydropyrimidinase